MGTGIPRSTVTPWHGGDRPRNRAIRERRGRKTNAQAVASAANTAIAIKIPTAHPSGIAREVAASKIGCGS
jgi:hypothetical protein